MKKAPTIELGNGKKVLLRNIYMKNTKNFKIEDIDINKIRVSNRKIYLKENNSRKHYIFYDHNNEYIPLRIIFKHVVAKYYVFKKKTPLPPRKKKEDEF